MSYSLSHASVVRWSLEMELAHLKVTADRQEVFRIMNYLEDRIQELKELEKELSLINSKGSK